MSTGCIPVGKSFPGTYNGPTVVAQAAPRSVDLKTKVIVALVVGFAFFLAIGLAGAGAVAYRLATSGSSPTPAPMPNSVASLSTSQPTPRATQPDVHVDSKLICFGQGVQGHLYGALRIEVKGQTQPSATLRHPDGHQEAVEFWPKEGSIGQWEPRILDINSQEGKMVEGTYTLTVRFGERILPPEQLVVSNNSLNGMQAERDIH